MVSFHSWYLLFLLLGRRTRHYGNPWDRQGYDGRQGGLSVDPIDNQPGSRRNDNQIDQQGILDIWKLLWTTFETALILQKISHVLEFVNMSGNLQHNEDVRPKGLKEVKTKSKKTFLHLFVSNFLSKTWIMRNISYFVKLNLKPRDDLFSVKFGNQLSQPFERMSHNMSDVRSCWAWGRELEIRMTD